ncbi:MAG: pilus assembly protein PilP [Nevskiaceae bacterium]|jgi:type IV pilus assembly protein PilP|nr:pilus assembly protein PilP [Nevskiaceae bacterium]
MKTIASTIFAAALLAGCSSRDNDLQQFITQVQQEQPSGVAPLPEVKPYESFTYASGGRRSPFIPGAAGGGVAGVRPDSKRNHEFLEQFSLDTLNMVGTMFINGRNYGLVRTRDGLVHRVLPGNYLGQNDGRITSIESNRINVAELVPDGLGGFIERASSIALNE